MTEEEAKMICDLMWQDDMPNKYIAEVRESLEKQIAKKPRYIDKNGLFDGNWVKVCPVCGRKFLERFTNETMSYPIIYYKSRFCDCGQKIDWSEEE